MSHPNPTNTRRDLGLFAALIEHPDDGLILYETGCAEDLDLVSELTRRPVQTSPFPRCSWRPPDTLLHDLGMRSANNMIDRNGEPNASTCFPEQYTRKRTRYPRRSQQRGTRSRTSKPSSSGTYTLTTRAGSSTSNRPTSPSTCTSWSSSTRCGRWRPRATAVSIWPTTCRSTRRR